MFVNFRHLFEYFLFWLWSVTHSLTVFRKSVLQVYWSFDAILDSSTHRYNYTLYMSDGELEIGGSPLGGSSSAGGKSPGDSAIEAFSLFKTYLDSQLNNFKHDLINIKLSSEDKNPVSLKKESNKIQYIFNSKIQEGLEALRSLNLPRASLALIDSLVPKIKHKNNR